MDLLTLTKGLALVDLLILLLAAVVGSVRFKQRPIGWRYLVAYLWVVLAVEVWAKAYVFIWTDAGNLYLLHLYTLVEFVLLSLMYRSFLGLSDQGRRNLAAYVLIGAVAIAVYSITELIRVEPPAFSQFQLYSKVLVNSTLLVFASWLVVRALYSPERYLDGFRTVLALNSGVMLYFAGSFVIFLTLTYQVAKDIERSIALWLINVILTLVFHVICLYTLWQRDSRIQKM